MTRYVISMTSYPPRFAYLSEVLELAVAQDPAPEAVFLNIAYGDMDRFIDTVDRPRGRRGALMQVVPCSNTGPAKKLLPTLTRVSGLPILVIDDDVRYPRDLARTLLQGLAQSPDSIVAGRARQLRLTEGGSIGNYRSWRLLEPGEKKVGADLVPTGMGGILFPPEVLHVDAGNERAYLTWAPRADDLWWYFQARRVLTTIHKVPFEAYPEQIEGTAEVGLYDTENRTENDSVMANLVRLYGHPLQRDEIWAGPSVRVPIGESTPVLGTESTPVLGTEAAPSRGDEGATSAYEQPHCTGSCQRDLEAMRALEMRLARIQSALQHESALLDRSCRELEELEARFLEVSRANEMHQQMLAEVFGSRSWRLTKPLRRQRHERVHE